MKKTLSLVMALALTLSMTTVAMAATSNGKITAPGQADNFSKGITTEVTYSVEVATPHVSKENKTVTEIRQTGTRVDSVVGTPIITMVTDWNNIIGTVTHPQFPWTANLYSATVTSTATTTNTQVDTFASFDVAYERTVSTFYLIKRTVQHQGAPNSNGKVISDVSEEIVTRVVFGDWIELSATEISGTSFEVTKVLADTVNVQTTFETVQGEWIKPFGTPGTVEQGQGNTSTDTTSTSNGADPVSSGNNGNNGNNGNGRNK